MMLSLRGREEVVGLPARGRKSGVVEWQERADYMRPWKGVVVVHVNVYF